LSPNAFFHIKLSLNTNSPIEYNLTFLPPCYFCCSRYWWRISTGN